MAPPRTTICCSALALITAAVVFSDGETPPTLSFFPLRAVWTLALNNSLAAPAAFNGSRAYFPIEGDRLAAYDLANGALQWVVSAPTRSKPAVGDDLVFIVEPSALTARRETDGSDAWRLPFTERLAAPLVWDNGWLIAATFSGTILAFRAVDGRLIWTRDVGSPANAPPALAADRVYVSASDGRVVALRVDTGVPIWERSLGGAPDAVLALDDRLYVGSEDNFFYCLKTSDGQVAWRWRTGADVIGTAAADERHVYFVSFDNVLRALDRRSGSQRWKRALPFRPTRGPLNVGGTLLVSGAAPPLRGFLATDGAPAGDVPADGELAGAPHVVDDPMLPLLVVVTRDIAKGALVTAFTRSIEPAVVPMAPLPNPVTAAMPTSP